MPAGGTIDQVLRKATNSDFATEWGAVDLGNPIATEGALPATKGGTGQGSWAKGSILVGVDATSAMLIGGGSAGDVATLDPASPAGVYWKPPPAGGTPADDSITNAKLRNSAALSVIGRAANSVGDPADIAASADNQVLQRTGSALSFAGIPLATSGIITGALPLAKGGTGLTAGGLQSQVLMMKPDASGVAVWGDLPGTHATAGGRLTIDPSAAPLPITDMVGQATLFYSAFLSDVIYLLVGSRWIPFTIANQIVPLTPAANTNYDIFAWYNFAIPGLDLEAVAWTNATTRAAALTRVNGILVRSGQSTRRYLGTVRTAADATFEDSAARRYVWNYYNRRVRLMRRIETVDSWQYTIAAFRQAGGNAANKMEYVMGVEEEPIKAMVRGMAYSVSNVVIAVGIGLGSSTVNSATLYGHNPNNNLQVLQADYQGFPGIGYRELRWLEYSQATGTTNWYGDNGNPTVFQFGMMGEILA